jgi:hypothetical protein
MPNWASSIVTITGEQEIVTEIKNRLAKPYANPHNPEEKVEGVFLLWNIIKPNNLSAYLGKEQAEFTNIINADPDLAELNKPVELSDDLDENLDNFLPKILHDLATGDEWYEWNCRNWGTKWEIGDKATLDLEVMGELSFDDKPVENSLELVYAMYSAWSPPVEALNSLAEQYPTIKISLSSIDENDCFAMSAFWQDGNNIYEQDVEITHELGMELRGYCLLECCSNYDE